jgi:nucleoside-diphosphate-sugar epimerase
MTGDATTSPKNIVFTGGSGVAGRHAVAKLVEYGHNVLNLDLTPLDNPQVHTIKTDLTQSGQVFNGLSSHFKITEPFPKVRQKPDAVIHFAGYPRNLLVPDDELFRVNILSSYNVIEAACKLGIKKIILASSVTTYGVTFAEGDVEYPSFPLDETLDVNPMDTYAISKLCMERVARGFANRFGIDVYVLRLGAVITPDKHEQMFKGYVENPGAWKGHGWSYTDVRDLGKACHLCLQKDGLGFTVFNTVNDEITNITPTEEFLKRTCPNTPITRSMAKFEAPISNQKLRKLLGFREEYGWRRLSKL